MSSVPAKYQPTLDLLSRAHSPSSSAAIFSEKVLHKPLLLRPTSPDPTSHDAREARRRKRFWTKRHALRKQKPRPLSAKQKRQLGLFDIPKEQQRYDLFVKLHEMWIGYMKEILGLKDHDPKRKPVTATTSGTVLASADFHGALIEVVRCRCVDRVGAKGIVVKDTKFTFEIITKQNMLKIIPKEHTIFRFELPTTILQDSTDAMDTSTSTSAPADASDPLVFELHGSQFKNRAVDRAIKKFKMQRMDDL